MPLAGLTALLAIETPSGELYHRPFNIDYSDAVCHNNAFIQELAQCTGNAPVASVAGDRQDSVAHGVWKKVYKV